ncbi:MAG TPA: hypothetical protein VNT32_00845 [Thermoleophilaceae bacterium]|nr:hypothetical protein [Thermoleophilaceae bacterium]
MDALELVMSNLLRLYPREAAERWLFGLNPRGGGRPLARDAPPRRTGGARRPRRPVGLLGRKGLRPSR